MGGRRGHVHGDGGDAVRGGEGCAHSEVPHVPGGHGGGRALVGLARGAAYWGAGLVGRGKRGVAGRGGAWLLVGGISETAAAIPCRAKMNGVVCWKAVLH